MKKIEIEELFDYYYLTEKGEVWSDYSKKFLKIMPTHSYKLKARNGKIKNYSQKELYKRTFGTVFCNDTTESKEGEIWRDIKGTDGKYQVSNLRTCKKFMWL